MNDEYRTMIKRISLLTDKELQVIWDNLGFYKKSEEYAPGISMDDWAMEIKGQLDYRKAMKEEAKECERS